MCSMSWLNNTTNFPWHAKRVVDDDPPFCSRHFENGYDESLDDDQRPFWYVQLKKRF